MAAQKDQETEWKRIQTKTFTRWCNEHLKVQRIEIAELSTAFCDGVNLIILLEILSGKSLGRYNKTPKRVMQKMENVTKALDFVMKTEKIKLVNIGAGDIATPNLKLILGLVWTLILHYQISHGFQIDDSNSPRHGGHSGQSAKQALLDYIREKLPNKTINNLTTDWNDGILIASLVDAHAPGLCTEAEAMDPDDSLENATLAMTLAQNWLGIAQLLEPQDMVNPKVDELSMMTYLSQFHEAELKPGAPLKPRVDLSKVMVYGPGVEENGYKGIPEKAVFTVDITGAGSGVVSAHCTGPDGPVNVDIEDNHDQTYTCTYIPQGVGEHTINVELNGKPVKDSPFTVKILAGPDSSKVKVSGPGLQGGCVREPLKLIIDSKDAGEGSVNISIDGPEATTTADTLDDETNSLIIIPLQVGEYNVQVEYGGQRVPGSPFLIPVCDPSQVKVLGAGTKEEGVYVGELAEVLVDITDSGVGPLEVTVTFPDGTVEVVKMTPATDQPNVLRGSYRPSVPGVYKVDVHFAKVNVLSNRVPAAQHAQISGSKVAYVDFDNIIDVYAADGDMGADFQFQGRPGLQGVDCNFERKSANHQVVHYTPHHVGMLIVTVQCAGTSLRHEVRCLDPSKVTVSEGIHSAIADTEQTFIVDASLAGPGTMDVQIKGPTEQPLHIDVVDSAEAPGVYSVTYTPANSTSLSAPPICKVEISFEGKAIEGSPFEVQVSSPDKVKAYGLGLEKAIAMEASSFTVDASQAGDGSLNLTIEGPEECDIDCNPNGDHIYCVSYVPPLAGTYSVNIKFVDVHIPGSPFLVSCSRVPPDASKCHAVMEKDNQAIMVDARDAGGTGALEVGVWGVQVPARYVTVEHNGDYTFNVSYEIQEPGEAEISIKWHGQHITGSPFKVITEQVK